MGIYVNPGNQSFQEAVSSLIYVDKSELITYTNSVLKTQKYFGEIKKWYDGYRLGDSQIYNPKSVVDALTWKKVKSYWTETETYEALKVYIERNFGGLREAVVEMIGGGGAVQD